jgi:hypothetical protein
MEKPINFAGENPDDMNYPIGIQTFAKLHENDFSYVDKTAYVYRLASQGSCYFLGTAQEALEQINSNDYAVPYQDTGLPVVKIGIGFSREKRTVSEWVIEK